MNPVAISALLCVPVAYPNSITIFEVKDLSGKNHDDG